VGNDNLFPFLDPPLTHPPQEDVTELIELSDDIRRRRRDRAAGSGWDRVDKWERQHHLRPMRGFGMDDIERVSEKKVYYDRPGMRYR
jgi:hypothetical protein